MQSSNRIKLFSYPYRIGRLVKSAVYEAASVAVVAVNGVYEKPITVHGTRKTLFRRREVKTERVEGYEYYAEVTGLSENVIRFDQVMKGFIIGYNARNPHRQSA